MIILQVVEINRTVCIKGSVLNVVYKRKTQYLNITDT